MAVSMVVVVAMRDSGTPNKRGQQVVLFILFYLLYYFLCSFDTRTQSTYKSYSTLQLNFGFHFIWLYNITSPWTEYFPNQPCQPTIRAPYIAAQKNQKDTWREHCIHTLRPLHTTSDSSSSSSSGTSTAERIEGKRNCVCPCPHGVFTISRLCMRTQGSQAMHVCVRARASSRTRTCVNWTNIEICLQFYSW